MLFRRKSASCKNRGFVSRGFCNKKRGEEKMKKRVESISDTVRESDWKKF